MQKRYVDNKAETVIACCTLAEVVLEAMSDFFMEDKRYTTVVNRADSSSNLQKLSNEKMYSVIGVCGFMNDIVKRTLKLRGDLSIPNND